ncbi:[NiFe]-hydrogenase assembly chaperone HybE [Tepidimonas aquatica]|uniref:Hydrogenase-2 operon protein HybE n=1 Tax=Tepidimonas aquatica TaxID=247482 RepID=A0A554WLW0_9BURK|nr:[NiFe]-hydrogenase assembly chaperone HybE [Tepidimonas aquatica]TSE24558.1 Hydrogenase-2 operon protein HybE [Tepidimonas aquatica]
MTDVDHSNPSGRLEAAFRHIADTRMAGMALVNPALAVEAVGFRQLGQVWVGVLITPWSMSLICLPATDAEWEALPSGTKREVEFPSGTYEFLTAHEAVLGPYLTSSLFSPMFDFADMDQARAVAVAVLAEVFAPQAADIPATPAPSLSTKLERSASRRGFLGALLGQGSPS